MGWENSAVFQSKVDACISFYAVTAYHSRAPFQITLKAGSPGIGWSGNLQIPVAFCYSIYQQHPALILRVKKAKFDEGKTVYSVNLRKWMVKIVTAKCLSWHLVSV